MDMRSPERGFTLIELCAGMALVVLLFAISVNALRSGAPKSSPQALAMALADRMRGARLLAIRSGHPIAIGIPATNGNPVSTSIYRLEGWNAPHVSWSRSFSGDHPGVGFAGASWSPSAGTFSNGAAAPPVSKFGVFNLTNWIPAAHATDAIYCFTPDGGVVTNSQPALDGRYTVVVARNLVVGGTQATGGGNPYVVYISTAGAVEVGTGVPGTQLFGGAPVADGAPKLRDSLAGKAQVNLSDIVVAPNPGSVTADGFCVPGQHVTLELWAYDVEGRELFAKWNQTSSGGSLGTFSFPYVNSSNTFLTGELERMEYVDQVPAYVNWTPSTAAPTGGAFRGRWSWTVPIDSRPGDRYTLEADVRDAKGEVDILNAPPRTFTTQVPPEGRLIVERLNAATGAWELVRMNPDGSGEKVLTRPGMEEFMPSVDRNGDKLAYLQRPIGGTQTAVKVRSIHGGQEDTIAAAGSGVGNFTSVSISPDGQWVSYRDDHGPTGVGSAPVVGELITVRVDGSREFRRPQSWEFGFGPNAQPLKKSRSGWNWVNPGTEEWMRWGNQSTLVATNLADDPTDPGRDALVINTITSVLGSYIEQLYAPTVFTEPGGTQRIIYTIGNVDPVLSHIPFDVDPGTPPLTGNTNMFTMVDMDGPTIARPGSAGENDNFPSVSSDGRFLFLPRENMASGARKAIMIPWDGVTGNYVGSPTNLEIVQDIRNVIWIP